ncbi:MAG: exo-beta-N-acetylmuramidase NamZ domain-containing protein [Acidobacteriota bacterium]
MQDVGARFYTYGCAMLYGIEEAAKAGVAFYVLDRPNPVTGQHVEGPVLDDALRSKRRLLQFACAARHDSRRDRGDGQRGARLEGQARSGAHGRLAARGVVR